MRIWNFLRKSLKENLRDWKILLITLIMAPIYVLITYTTVGNSNPIYQVIVNNQDQGFQMEDGTVVNLGEDSVNALKTALYLDGSPMFKVVMDSHQQLNEKKLKDRDVEVLLVIPADFSQVLQEKMSVTNRVLAKMALYGDESNPKYAIARILVDTTIYSAIATLTNTEMPMEIVGIALDDVEAPTPFEAYIPGMLALSLISLIFTAVASIIKEIDKGTMKRIKISKLSPMEFLTSVSITQALISIPVLLLTYCTAYLFGYRPEGSLISVMLVGFISSFSIMAVSLLIASFINTIFELMTVGTLPYFILLFFSGAWFPMSGKTLFSIGSHSFGLTDLLPISHTVSAMNKILNYGANFSEILFEMGTVVVITIIYFSIGIPLFTRKHMGAI